MVPRDCIPRRFDVYTGTSSVFARAPAAHKHQLRTSVERESGPTPLACSIHGKFRALVNFLFRLPVIDGAEAAMAVDIQ